MEDSRIGFLEVGSCFGRDLAKAGATVRAYDKFWDSEPMRPHIRQRSYDAGVLLAERPEALLDWADVVISVTSPNGSPGDKLSGAKRTWRGPQVCGPKRGIDPAGSKRI